MLLESNTDPVFAGARAVHSCVLLRDRYRQRAATRESIASSLLATNKCTFHDERDRSAEMHSRSRHGAARHDTNNSSALAVGFGLTVYPISTRSQLPCWNLGACNMRRTIFAISDFPAMIPHPKLHNDSPQTEATPPRRIRNHCRATSLAVRHLKRYVIRPVARTLPIGSRHQCGALLKPKRNGGAARPQVHLIDVAGGGSRSDPRAAWHELPRILDGHLRHSDDAGRARMHPGSSPQDPAAMPVEVQGTRVPDQYDIPRRNC